MFVCTVCLLNCTCAFTIIKINDNGNEIYYNNHVVENGASATEEGVFLQ